MLNAPNPSMVIMTPTTEEWREIKGIHQEVDSPVRSSGSSEDGGRSGRDEAKLGVVLPTDQRPALRPSVSADYIFEETLHTPDPGFPVVDRAFDNDEKSFDRPVFNPVIIAPSPIIPAHSKVPFVATTPTREGASSAPLIAQVKVDDAIDSSPEIDADSPIAPRSDEDTPVHFNSIGRRESLTAIRIPGLGPRTKTKRELEREKLFKDLDEQLKADREESQDMEQSWSGGVTEIGLGAGLGSRPGSSLSSRTASTEPGREAVHDEPSHPGKVLAPKARDISLTSPIVPSPLHAAPFTPSTGLPTPESPDDEAGYISKRSPSPKIQAANLEAIRDYARQLASSAHLNMRARSGKSTPSPPLSPQSPRPRRRDVNRVSLVAGRVVQPFAIPSSTSLPPQSERSEKPTPSLQSFSPFRSPTLNASAPPIPPLARRFDSTVSIAPSTGAPSECGTPTSETAGGIGGRGIEDYVILKEAGKGAYGLVMRAKVKGPKGEPVGVSLELRAG